MGFPKGLFFLRFQQFHSAPGPPSLIKSLAEAPIEHVVLLRTCWNNSALHCLFLSRVVVGCCRTHTSYPGTDSRLDWMERHRQRKRTKLHARPARKVSYFFYSVGAAYFQLPTCLLRSSQRNYNVKGITHIISTVCVRACAGAFECGSFFISSNFECVCYFFLFFFFSECIINPSPLGPPAASAGHLTWQKIKMERRE